MLTLSRDIGEKVKLSGGITVQVIAVQGPHVKLGFEAPDEVKILREELAGSVDLGPSGPSGLRTTNVTYLACPYSHDNPAVLRDRFEAVTKLAARLIRSGKHIYSPISHSHAITETGLPCGWEFWASLSLAMLGVCDDVLVYCIDGWDRSVGVRAEVMAAEASGKPVRYLMPEMADIEERKSHK